MTISQTPPFLARRFARVTDVPGNWFVLEVLPRNEKALAWQFDERGVAYYLPMAQRIRFHGTQRRRVTLPLFPGYIFVAGDVALQAELLDRQNYPEIFGIIDVVDQKRLIGELAALQRTLENNPCLGELIDVPAGVRCRIIAGPLAGLEVIVCQSTGKTVLAVNVLNRAMEIQIEPACLEAV